MTTKLTPDLPFLHEAMARALVQAGRDVIFGLPGDGNLYLLDAFRRAGGRFVGVMHEASAVLAAAGFAGVTGGIGVACVTHGPGVANAVGALIEGVKARVPIVLIAGDTSPEERDHLQQIDQQALVEATGAGFVHVDDPAQATADLALALRIAEDRWLPVVLDIPAELMWTRTRADSLPVSTSTPHPVDAAELERAGQAIASARRPVVIAGRGAIGAEVAVRELAARAGAPLGTTLRARGLFTGHPNDIGIVGKLAHGEAARIVAESDCIISFGASLNPWTTIDGATIRDRAVIQVDRAPDADRVGATGLFLCGDATDVARALAAGLAPPTSAGDSGLRARLAADHEHAASARAARLDRELQRERDGARREGTVHVATALALADDLLPEDRVLVLDAGRFTRPALAEMDVRRPTDYVHGVNFGSIGVGVPYAIGAAIGAPGRRVVAVCGDGGFQLGGAVEYPALVREGLDVTVLVVDDAAYGAEHVLLRRRSLSTDLSHLGGVDPAAIARAAGGVSHDVHTLGELETALAVQTTGPLLIDIHADAEELTAEALNG